MLLEAGLCLALQVTFVCVQSLKRLHVHIMMVTLQEAACLRAPNGSGLPFRLSYKSAVQEDELKQAGLKQGGVLTPASALGMVFIKRLQDLGVVSFKIRDDPSFEM